MAIRPPPHELTRLVREEMLWRSEQSERRRVPTEATKEAARNRELLDELLTSGRITKREEPIPPSIEYRTEEFRTMDGRVLRRPVLTAIPPPSWIWNDREGQTIPGLRENEERLARVLAMDEYERRESGWICCCRNWGCRAGPFIRI